VETGPVEEILQRLSHPYTQELLPAVPEVAASEASRASVFPGRQGCGANAKAVASCRTPKTGVQALKFIWQSSVMQGRRQ